ncbi:MAG: RagB/SusD family nutrient uptake outer membrane protein [Gemmatimonadales bacterium]
MRKPGSRYPIRIGGRRALTLLLLLPVLAVLPGCSLDENPTSVITPDNYFQNEDEVIAGLAQVYGGLRQTMWSYYNLSEVSTDEMVVPTRGSDWFDNGRWLEIHQQSFTANSPSGLEDINGAWNDFFGGVADANVVLAGLENVTLSDGPTYVAELRTLRALYYYLLMDFFGGVPIATDPAIEARPRATRAELFNFLEQELLAARPDLPTSWSANYQGRMTQGAVDALLASMYLNAEVFTGTVTTSGLQRGQARWQDAIDAAERLINSGVYSLETDWTHNFAPDNYTSPELILVAKFLNQSGLGNTFPMRALHYNQLAPAPWNGFSTLAETYFKFDLQDDERTEIFLVGQQKSYDTGEGGLQRARKHFRGGQPREYDPSTGVRSGQAAQRGRLHAGDLAGPDSPRAALRAYGRIQAATGPGTARPVHGSLGVQAADRSVQDPVPDSTDAARHQPRARAESGVLGRFGNFAAGDII